MRRSGNSRCVASTVSCPGGYCGFTSVCILHQFVSLVHRGRHAYYLLPDASMHHELCRSEGKVQLSQVKVTFFKPIDA